MHKFETEEIEVKLLTKTAKLPTRGSEQAAGYDLYADIEKDIVINPHETVKIGTGLAVKVLDGFGGFILPRSGIATKQGLRPANTPGLIDPDYTGEIFIAIHNDSNHPQTIVPQERIAQLVVMPFLPLDFTIVDELDKTARGSGGFGSTGTK